MPFIPSRRVCLWLLALAMAGISGCTVATTRPLYNPKQDVVFDARLVGTWGNADECLRISRGADKGYELTDLTPQQPPGAAQQPVRAELVPIGKYRYLFVCLPGNQGTLLFPCYRVEFKDTSVRLQVLNIAMIEDYLNRHPGTLRFEKKPSKIVPQGAGAATQPGMNPAWNDFLITDEPPKVRRFLEAHQDDPGFVCEPMILQDVSPFALRCPSSPKSPSRSGGRTAGTFTWTEGSSSAVARTSSQSSGSAKG